MTASCGNRDCILWTKMVRWLLDQSDASEQERSLVCTVRSRGEVGRSSIGGIDGASFLSQELMKQPGDISPGFFSSRFHPVHSSSPLANVWLKPGEVVSEEQIATLEKQ